MRKYGTIKYSFVLLIFVLASCSSAPLKKTEPVPSAPLNTSATAATNRRSPEPPTLIPELCSLAVSERTSVPEGRATRNAAQANKTNSQIPELKFPVPSGALSSGFGYRRGIFHTGLDIKAPRGDDVLACEDGEVVLAGTRKGYRSYGRTVLIDHGKDVFTLYAHLSSIHVAAGQKVRQRPKDRLRGMHRTGHCSAFASRSENG